MNVYAEQRKIIEKMEKKLCKYQRGNLKRKNDKERRENMLKRESVMEMEVK